jgi:hypothetical protein
MRERTAQIKVKQKLLITQLFLFITFFCFSHKTDAQGWSFTFQMYASGNCGGVQPPAITLPHLGLPTKSQCESLRQQVLAVKGSSGGCTVGYTCTPCIGSDIIVPGQGSITGQGSTSGVVSPGEVSFDGLFEGKPLFTTHQSSAFEDWARDYRQQLNSYGITSILGKNITSSEIPLTDNMDFNKFYYSQSATFNPDVPVTVVDAKPTQQEVSYDPVPIMGSTPLTADEIERQKLINQFGPGYIDQANMFSEISSSDKGIEENTSSGESFSDKLLDYSKDELETSYGKFVGNLSDVVCSNTSAVAKILGGEEATTLTAQDEMQVDPRTGLVKASIKTITDEVKESVVGAIIGKAVDVVEYLGEKAVIVLCPNMSQTILKMDYKNGLELGKYVIEKTQNAMKVWGVVSHN